MNDYKISNFVVWSRKINREQFLVEIGKATNEQKILLIQWLKIYILPTSCFRHKFFISSFLKTSIINEIINVLFTTISYFRVFLIKFRRALKVDTKLESILLCVYILFELWVIAIIIENHLSCDVLLLNK